MLNLDLAELGHEAEYSARGANPRFIATSLMGAPQWLKSVNSRNIRARPKFS